ncbi:MAG TPA: hypothetical protein DCE14_01525 [Kosmotogaceae bacterium]|nr:hypothetical protein [Kosmotogaceae bacterium]
MADKSTKKVAHKPGAPKKSEPQKKSSEKNAEPTKKQHIPCTIPSYIYRTTFEVNPLGFVFF